MATVRLLLEKSNLLKDNTYPLVFRILHRRSKRSINTTFKLFEHEFDLISEKVCFISEETRPLKDVLKINREVNRQRQALMDRIEEVEQIYINYDIDLIIKSQKIESKDLELFTHINTLISIKMASGKTGTAKAYARTHSSLLKFIFTNKFYISNITSLFVKEYEQHLILRKISANTVCYYLRNLKSIYNQSFIDEINKPIRCPFNILKIRPKKTKKRALRKDALRRIKNLDLTHKETTWSLARDLFMFSFYTRGMPLVDVLHLKKESINSDRITYYRQKTGQLMEVLLTKESIEIITHYLSESDYIFPLLSDSSDISIYEQYIKSSEHINRYLKIIGEQLHLRLSLTSYVARHTWATIAKDLGAPTSVISESLGHASEQITQIYLKEFDSETLDNINRKVVEL